MQKAANWKTAGNGPGTRGRKAIRKGMPHSRLTGLHTNMGQQENAGDGNDKKPD